LNRLNGLRESLSTNDFGHFILHLYRPETASNCVGGRC
jgi:hypothetical protein